MQMLATRTVGSGPTLIFFLHWLSGSGSSWAEVTNRLVQTGRFRCVEIDLPGFGASASVLGYSVGEMTEAVSAVIARETGGAQPTSWMLAAHSMGAKIALAIARRIEDEGSSNGEPRAIVLLAGSPPTPEPMEDRRRGEMKSWVRGGEGMTRVQAKAFLDQNRTHTLSEGTERQALDDLLRMNKNAWLAWLQDGSREDWSRRIGVLRTPALIVAGEHDADLGAAAQQALMLPHFAKAEIRVLANAKHLLPLEYPLLVAGMIEEATAFEPVAPSSRESIPAEYLQLIESERVSPQTRSVLLQRAEPAAVYQPRVLTAPQLAVLRALSNRVVPQDGEEAYLDLAVNIDRQLSEGLGNGWRYDVLPCDADAYRDGIRTLDAVAKSIYGAAFAALSEDKQDAILESAAGGQLGNALDLGTSSMPTPPLTGEQMKRWFEEVRGDLVRVYVAHPATLARIGFSGIGDGAESQTMPGFVQLGLGQRESWETLLVRGAR